MSLSRRKRVLETALRIVVGSLSDRCRIVVRSLSDRIVVGSLSVSFAVLADRHRSSLLVDCRYSACLRLRRSLRCADRHAVSIVPLVPIVTPERIATSRRSRRRRR